MNSTDFYGMIILMVIFSYLVMSNVMLTWKNGIYNHANKVYMALLMGSLMGMIHFILMIFSRSEHHMQTAFVGLIISIVISLILIGMIRKQTLVNDKEFLKGMIEHHDMALLMSDAIRKKTEDERIKQLADNIISTQQDEINLMKSWL